MTGLILEKCIIAALISLCCLFGCFSFSSARNPSILSNQFFIMFSLMAFFAVEIVIISLIFIIRG